MDMTYYFELFTMATAKEHSEGLSTCLICLGDFSLPRRIPCPHISSQLSKSYITIEAREHDEKLEHIQCPIFRQTASPFK